MPGDPTTPPPFYTTGGEMDKIHKAYALFQEIFDCMGEIPREDQHKQQTYIHANNALNKAMAFVSALHMYDCSREEAIKLHNLFLDM